MVLHDQRGLVIPSFDSQSVIFNPLLPYVCGGVGTQDRCHCPRKRGYLPMKWFAMLLLCLGTFARLDASSCTFADFSSTDA